MKAQEKERVIGEPEGLKVPEKYRDMVDSVQEVNTLGGKYALVMSPDYEWASDDGISYFNSWIELTDFLSLVAEHELDFYDEK